MHLIHQLAIDLAAPEHLAGLTFTRGTLLASLITVAVVMIALVLPFPHGEGAIAQTTDPDAASSARRRPRSTT